MQLLHKLLIKLQTRNARDPSLFSQNFYRNIGDFAVRVNQTKYRRYKKSSLIATFFHLQNSMHKLQHVFILYLDLVWNGLKMADQLFGCKFKKRSLLRSTSSCPSPPKQQNRRVEQNGCYSSRHLHLYTLAPPSFLSL